MVLIFEIFIKGGVFILKNSLIQTKVYELCNKYDTFNPVDLCMALNVSFIARKLHVFFDNPSCVASVSFSHLDETEDLYVVACRLGNFILGNGDFDSARGVLLTSFSFEARIFATFLLLCYFYTVKEFDYFKADYDEIALVTGIPIEDVYRYYELSFGQLV